MTSKEKISEAHKLLSEVMNLLDGTENVREETFEALISVREEVEDLIE